MNAKTLGTLSVTAAALVVVAFVMHRSGQADSATTELGPLAPALQQDVNRADSLRLVQGEKSFEYRRGVSGWVSPAHDDFPVLEERVREALIQLVRLEKKDALTDKPERWATLQLDEPGPDSEARGVRLSGGEETLLEVVIGKDKWGASPGVYARLAGENQTWLCDGRVNLPREATDWLEKRVGEIGIGEIESVVLERGDAALHLAKDEAVASDWQLAEMPADRALKSPNPLGRIAGALGWLNFEDVRNAEKTALDGEPAFVVRYRTTNRQQIEVRGWELDGETWCALRAEVLPEEADDGEAEEGEPQEDPQLKVDEWNGKWQGWVYRFPSTSLDLWRSDLESLLEPLPEPEPEPAAKVATEEGSDQS